MFGQDIGHVLISIHPPCEGRDLRLPIPMTCLAYFNPPSPWGEGPSSGRGFMGWLYFNPPSPWGERQETEVAGRLSAVISIHPPRGGRDGFIAANSTRARAFQSTLPVGGETMAAW